MTANQQYWHINGGGVYVSRLYPLPAGTDGYRPGPVVPVSSRSLSYGNPPPEGFVSSVVPIAARLSSSPRIPFAVTPEGFASSLTLLSSAVQHYTRIAFAQAPEGYAPGPVTLVDSDAEHFTRVAFAPEAEGFVSSLTLIGSAVDRDAWRIQTLAPEGYMPGPVTLISAEFSVPPIRDYHIEVLDDAPLGYWRLEEASGSWSDSSGNGYTASPGNRTLTRLQSPNITAGYACTIGGAQATNPAVGIVADSAVWQFGASAFTFECWIRGAAGSSGVIGAKYLEGSLWPAWYYIVTAGSGSSARIGIEYRTSNSSAVAYSNQTPFIATLNDGNPHHIVIVRSPPAVYVYVDGVQYTLPNFSGTIWSSTAPTGIGGFPSAIVPSGLSGYPGTFDEIAIYATALPADRVSVHYTAGMGKE